MLLADIGADVARIDRNNATTLRVPAFVDSAESRSTRV
jgi:hypothetical protein